MLNSGLGNCRVSIPGLDDREIRACRNFRMKEIQSRQAQEAL
jgi:hypothetical protein